MTEEWWARLDHRLARLQHHMERFDAWADRWYPRIVLTIFMLWIIVAGWIILKP